MSIQGRYEADFSQYKSETQSAMAQLSLFLQQAQRTAQALSTVGDPTPMDKFSATTTVTRQQIEALLGSAGKTTSVFSSLGTSLGAADKTLALLGVHIGPEIHALNELGIAAEASAGALGLLGPAVLVAATAFAAYKASQIDWDALDQKVASITDRVLNLGVATQTAAAKQDTINRAIDQGADVNIKYEEAIKFNTEKLKEHALGLQTSEQRLAAWQGEIRRVRSEGKLEQLTADIREGNSTVQEMALHYNVASRTIEYYTRVLSDQTKAEDEAARARKQHAAEMQAAEDRVNALGEARDEAVASIGKELFGANDIESAKAYAAAIGTVANAEKLFGEKGQQAADALWKGEQAAIATLGTMDPLVQTFEELRLAIGATAREATNLAAATAAADAETKRLADDMTRAYTASGGTDLAGFKSGLSGTGASHMQPFVGLQPSVFSAGGIAGVNTPGTYITNTFNVNGTGDDVARIVGDKLTQQAMIGGPKALGR